MLGLRQAVNKFGSAKKLSCAVIYSGCGVYDGTEVTEAVSLNIHLARLQANVTYFAPNVDQMHAINHLKGEPHQQTRNVLEESARIVRGKINDLATLDVSQFDALFIPGGFGAAKNLSTFAVDGAQMKVNEQVEKTIKQFHENKKVIGSCCIAPVVLAKVLEKQAKITLGVKQQSEKWPFAGSNEAAASFGSQVVEKDVTGVCVDEQNLLVTTPAFMYNVATPLEIYEGVGKMVQEVDQLVK